MLNNRKIKVELTIRKDLDTDEFLEELNDWMVEKDFINPLISIDKFPEKNRRKEWLRRWYDDHTATILK